MVGVGLWSEFEWDRNLNQFVTTVDNVNGLVIDVQTQVSNQILSLSLSLPPSFMIPSNALLFLSRLPVMTKALSVATLLHWPMPLMTLP